MRALLLLFLFLRSSADAEEIFLRKGRAIVAAPQLPRSNGCERFHDAARDTCNSFCEVKDCDNMEGDDDEYEECSQLKKLFQRQSKQRALPCELCPCWSLTALDEFLERSRGGGEDSHYDFECVRREAYDEIYTQSDPQDALSTQSQSKSNPDQSLMCMNLGNTPSVIRSITPEQAEICQSQIRAVCAKVTAAAEIA